jgi:PAS domain S-box-containing protein
MPLFVPKDRKSLFRQFLAGMYDAVVITDPNGHIIEINPRAEEYFGYLQEEVVDKPISVYIPSLSAAIVQRIRKGLDENRHVVIDANGENRDGVRFACEMTISSIEMVNPDDLVFTIRNVERRRKVRNMLRAKEGAFDISHAALFACDAHGAFTQMNAAFREMFEIAEEGDAPTPSFFDIMTDDPLPENFRKAIAGETSTTGIVAESDSDGKQEIEITLAPHKAGRKIRGVVGSIIKV